MNGKCLLIDSQANNFLIYSERPVLGLVQSLSGSNKFEFKRIKKYNLFVSY